MQSWIAINLVVQDITHIAVTITLHVSDGRLEMITRQHRESWVNTLDIAGDNILWDDHQSGAGIRAAVFQVSNRYFLHTTRISGGSIKGDGSRSIRPYCLVS